MAHPFLTWEQIEILFEELIAQQHARALACGRRIQPRLTEEDMLQPNDYPELENHPHFRYEEGVIEGLRTALMALRAERQGAASCETP